MPDIGLIELILIGIIGFLVLGPERLPEFLAQIAKVIRQGRGWVNSLKKQLEYEKHTLTNPIESVKDEIKTSMDNVNDEVKASIEDVSDAVNTEKKEK